MSGYDFAMKRKGILRVWSPHDEPLFDVKAYAAQTVKEVQGMERRREAFISFMRGFNKGWDNE